MSLLFFILQSTYHKTLHILLYVLNLIIEEKSYEPVKEQYEDLEQTHPVCESWL